MALTVVLVESIKQTVKIPKQWVWLLVLIAGAGFNALNAYCFGGNIVEAAKVGLETSATSAGIYSMAKAILKTKTD